MLVAAGQAAASPGDLVANLATAVRLVELAASQGARLLVLPEAFLTGYDDSAFDGPLPTAADHDGPLLDPLRVAAGAGRLTVVVGTCVDRGDHRTLSQVVVRPDGTSVLAYDKQHVDVDERPWFTAGDDAASVTVDDHTFGLGICYDACFPEHARAAAADGALGYAVSAAWHAGAEHRRDLYYATRALENSFYVVFSGLTGSCGASRFTGGSAVYDPEGRPLSRLGEEEGLALADVDPALVLATRARHQMHEDHRASLGERRVV